MAIKNLLIAYNGSDSSEAALDCALIMRDKYDAHLTGILAYSLPPQNQAASSWIPKEVRESIDKANAQAAIDIGLKFKQRIQSSSAPDKIHWISKRGEADETVARYARQYDLTILGRYDAVLGEEQPELHPDMIAMVSGRPVLLIPREFDMSEFHEHAVLAWDGKRASSRALSDAMQLLESESRVTIVTVEDGHAERALPEINVETALQRHGLETERVHLKRKGRSVGHRLLEFLEEKQPNILVMGAYEHSKFRQSILGGVTNSVLKKAKVPIMISH